MAFCKYCGTQYPDGGACTNPACPAANQAPVSEENPFIQSEQPAKKSSKGVYIALALVVLLIIAAVIVIVLLINNKKKEDEKKKEQNSHKAAVETYAEAMYEKEAFSDLMKVTMLEDVLKEYKKTDNYDEEKNDYKYMLERNEHITVSSIKKGDKLSDDELEAAEEYFDDQADYHDIDVDDIKITEGYEYTFKLKNAEYENKDTYTCVVCAVKVKDDGWKIIHADAKDLKELSSHQKEKNSSDAAVETYTEAMYEIEAFSDLMKVTMLEDVLKEYKKSDDYDDNNDDYKDMMEDLEDDDIEITVSSIKKGDKLSDDELEAAEEYFDDQAYDYDVDVDDIKVTEGYEYSYKVQTKEDGYTESHKETVCAVKVKGDGWKIISYDAEDLYDYYG